MLDLASPKWQRLRVPLGDARRIPDLIRAFQRAPGIDAFDNFFQELTGCGDLAIYDSFYAALPYAVEMIPLLNGSDFEQALAQLGWAIALSDESADPACRDESFNAAKHEVAILAHTLLHSGDPVEHRAYIVAALAAGRGRYDRALRIIDRI